MGWQDAERRFAGDAVADGTLPRTLERSAERDPDRTAQQYKGGVYDRSLVAAGVVGAAPAGAYADLDYAELRDVVRHLAAGFRAVGLGDGDRVAIYANTRMEWAQADFAALAAGGVVTTVYAAASRSRVRFLLADPGATVVVVENRAHLETVLAVRDDLDAELTAVVTMDEVETSDLTPDETALVYTLGEVAALGADAFDAASYASWLDATDADDLASIVYTSGTTGSPKGVRLTHATLRANVVQCLDRLGDRPDRDAPGLSAASTTLSFLPLAHVFERLIGHYLPFAAGGTVAYAERPATLAEDFALVEPTTAAAVPRVYETLFERVGGLETDAAIREAFGGAVDFFISGGGSLSPDLCERYHETGLPILEGYGLTETAPVVSVNPPDDPQIGTIGPPVVGTEVAIDERVDGPGSETAPGPVGELLVRGPQVTDGYWNRPDATDEAFSEPDALPEDIPTAGESPADRGGDPAEPWFHTGDVVRLRPDGHLVFRARAKRLLVLSTGENVAPGPIADRLTDDALVDQCVVLGDDRPFVSALLVPDFDRVSSWAADAGIDLPTDRQATCRDDRLRDRIATAVDAANADLEPVERVERFRLIAEPLTRANGLLTPTLKKKRRSILDRFADDVERIYGENDGAD